VLEEIRSRYPDETDDLFANNGVMTLCHQEQSRSRYNSAASGNALNLLRILGMVALLGAAAGSQELIDPGVLNARVQSRLKSLAGEKAIACGDVGVKGNTDRANGCVQDAFRSGKPFYVSYQGQGFDSVGSTALAMDSAKNFYALVSDSMGFAPPFPPGLSVDADWRVLVEKCPKPYALNLDRLHRLTCLPVAHVNDPIHD